MFRTKLAVASLAALTTLGVLATATACGQSDLSESFEGHQVGSASDTVDFTITNNSAERFVYQRSTGKAPAPSLELMLPGQSATVKVPDPGDFPWSHSSGDVWFAVMSPQNTQSATIDFHFDAVNVNDSKVTMTDSSGNPMPEGKLLWYGTTGSYTDYTLTDAAGAGNTDVTITPGQDGWTQDQVSSIAKQLCTNSNSCTFDNVTTTDASAAPVVLVSAYNDNVDGENTVGTSKGYETSVTNSWDTSYSADLELMDAVTLGVSHSVGYSVSTSTNFSTSYSAQNNAGYTTVIWGEAPMINATGDFTVKLGATTLNLDGADFIYPDPNGAMRYEAQQFSGNVTGAYSPAPGVNNNAPTQTQHKRVTTKQSN